MAPLPPAARRPSHLFKSVLTCVSCAGLLLLAGGCADNAPEQGGQGEPVQMGGVTVPESWHNGSDQVARDGGQAQADNEHVQNAAQLADWWKQFNDPILDELIESALAGNPGVRTALARIEESRARRGIALSPLLPMLSGRVSGSGSQRRNHETHTTTNSENYSASLNLSWELDLFGKQQLALDAAEADMLQTEENFYAAQVVLVAEVAEAYVELRAAQAQLSVLHRNITAREQTTELTQWRAQVGDVSEMESEQAQSTLEQARASIPSVEQNIALARNRLTLLCGLTPGSLDAQLEGDGPLPAAPQRIAIGIPLETLLQRPDVRAAEQALLAAVYRTRSAERERLPSINLSASIGVEALRAGNLFSPEATVASLLGGLTAPLFQGGRIMETIAVNEAQQAQVRINYELVILTALSEVENALIRVRQGMDRLEILYRATASAQLAATLAAQKYEAGQTDLLTVLEAQRTQLSLEEQTVNTAASLTSAHIQLYKALGGGWKPLGEDDKEQGDAAAQPEDAAAAQAAGKAAAQTPEVSAVDVHAGTTTNEGAGCVIRVDAGAAIDAAADVGLVAVAAATNAAAVIPSGAPIAVVVL